MKTEMKKKSKSSSSVTRIETVTKFEKERKLFFHKIDWRKLKMEIVYPKYLTTRLPNDVNDKFIVAIGIKDSGKTGCLLSLAEWLMQTWGKKDTEVLIFDPDSRVNQNYVLDNQFDFSEARKEIRERYESCTKRHWIFIASDARKLLSEYFARKDEKKEVLDFAYWFVQSRHINPDVEDAVWGAGLHKFEHLSSTLRTCMDNMIYKCSIGSVAPITKFWGLKSRKQIYKLLIEVAYYVSIDKYVELGSVFIPGLYKRMLFRTPHILIDFNKKRVRREIETQNNAVEEENDDMNMRIAEDGYKLAESILKNEGRFNLIKQDMGYGLGSGGTQLLENALVKYVKEVHPHTKPRDKYKEEGEQIHEHEGD
nr:hypothetical protein [Candidatus Freyarchaeota archaeon]